MVVLMLGVYAGGPEHCIEFATWLGAPVPIGHHFSPVGDQLGSWPNVPLRLLCSPHALQGSETLAQGATGSYDARWTALASRLVAIGHADAIVRPMWEFNGSWYGWRASTDNKAFKQYWRRIVDLMRAVPGSAFTFDWCVLCGRFDLADPSTAWPGAEYVDTIGIDLYDTGASVGLEAQKASWKGKANGSLGLDYYVAYAAAKDKQLSLPEWGLVQTSRGGGGDDVFFVEKVERWIALNNVAFHCYFNTDATGYGLGDHHLCCTAATPGPTPFPKAAARYHQLFGP